MDAAAAAAPAAAPDHEEATHNCEHPAPNIGPRNMDSHSKLPYFMRLHGSVTPRMILPLAMVGAWATCITCISRFVYPCTPPCPENPGPKTDI
ncbi:UPF0187 domain membrane protein [Diplocarpon rosae]|nr:UPF0187 domain membrane protein [Diplocarpon rosae]